MGRPLPLAERSAFGVRTIRGSLDQLLQRHLLGPIEPMLLTDLSHLVDGCQIGVTVAGDLRDEAGTLPLPRSVEPGLVRLRALRLFVRLERLDDDAPGTGQREQGGKTRDQEGRLPDLSLPGPPQYHWLLAEALVRRDALMVSADALTIAHPSR